MSVCSFCLLLIAALLASNVGGFLEELSRNKATFLTASVGGHVIFNCPIDFPHDIEIPYSLRWNKEGRTVFSWYDGVLSAAEPSFRGRVMLASTEGTSLGRGAVNLTAIREADSGWFECSVFFPNRKPNTRPNGTWFHLGVDGGTLLAEPPINVTLLEGSTAHFPCVTRDPSATVAWFKDGVPLDELPLRTRSTLHAEGSLSIGPVRMGDTGELHCVVTSATGERQTAGAFIDVQYKAKVVFSPREVLFPFGGPAMLDCHFRSNPALTNLRWEKDGFLFDPYNVPGVFTKRNGSLYFTQVDETHAGKYTCTPFNELGSAGPSPAVLVVVQRPPTFTVTPHNLYISRLDGRSWRPPNFSATPHNRHTYTCRLGDTLQMSCDTVDDATIVWLRKDGASLPANRTRLRNGNLTIERVEASDRGIYQCVASNMAASVTSEAELMIETLAPRAAHNLTATAGSSSISASWMAGSTRIFSHHELWWRAKDTGEWHALAVSEGTSGATVRHLSPGHVYQMQVVSREGPEGEGVVSRLITVVTENDDVRRNSALNSMQPLGPPRNLAAELTDAGALLHWEPPAYGAHEQVSYRVQWTHEDATVDTTNTWILVAGLRDDSTYTVTVSAVSADQTESTAHMELVIPSTRGVKAATVALAAAGVCLLVALAGGVYWKQRVTVQ